MLSNNLFHLGTFVTCLIIFDKRLWHVSLVPRWMPVLFLIDYTAFLNHDGLFVFSDLFGTNKSQTFILKHNMFRHLALVTCSTQLLYIGYMESCYQLAIHAISLKVSSLPRFSFSLQETSLARRVVIRRFHTWPTLNWSNLTGVIGKKTCS